MPRVVVPVRTAAGYINPALMDAFNCVAVGGYRASPTLEIKIIGICQRIEDPGIVEIDYEAEGDGVFDLDLDRTAFSLDSTNGKNGVWRKLVPLETDPRHTGNQITVGGRLAGRFVANMTAHLNDWLTQERIVFRLSFEFTESVATPLIDLKPILA